MAPARRTTGRSGAQVYLDLVEELIFHFHKERSRPDV